MVASAYYVHWALIFCDAGLDYYTGVIYEVVTEGSAPTAPASGDAKDKPSKKKGGKPGDPDEDRSDDPTLGIGMLLYSWSWYIAADMFQDLLLLVAG